MTFEFELANLTFWMGAKHAKHLSQMLFRCKIIVWTHGPTDTQHTNAQREPLKLSVTIQIVRLVTYDFAATISVFENFYFTMKIW